LKIGVLNDNRFLDIRGTVSVRLSLSSSVDTLPLFQHYSSSSFTSTPSYSTMSDIYTHEPVMDFTNPFLDFDQGYIRPFATILPAVKATLIPISSEGEESVLPKKPLTQKEIKTRRGYPHGESQGESSGQILLPSFFNQDVEESFIGLPFFKRKKGHFPSEEEREERDKHLFVYRYNQGGESSRRDNGGKPYPSLQSVRGWMMTSKYRHDGLRDLGLGDVVMVSKERWRKHINELDLETFPKSWIGRGLQEIHHEGDAMDGRMDACLGFAAVMGCEIYETIAEVKDDMREEQKKRALDGWERMNVKRSLEDSLRCVLLYSFLDEEY